MIRKAVDPREDAAGFVLVIVAGHRSFDDSGKYNGKAKSHDPIEVAHEELRQRGGGGAVEVPRGAHSLNINQ